MDDAIRKAEALIEALSYIRKFRDRLTVIKLGGSAMEDPDALRPRCKTSSSWRRSACGRCWSTAAARPIDRAMAAAGLQPRKIQGRRYTDDATLAIVVRVLTAGDQRRHRRSRSACSAAGPSACTSARSVPLRRTAELPGPDGAADRPGPRRPGHRASTRAARRLLRRRRRAGHPVAGRRRRDGGWLNVNADTAAAAVAAHLRAEKLVFLTDTPGILLDRKDPPRCITSLDAAGCRELIADGVIDAGMIPKVEACLDSLRGGVSKTHIIDGRLRHSLLLEIYTDRGVGTEIVLIAGHERLGVG